MKTRLTLFFLAVLPMFCMEMHAQTVTDEECAKYHTGEFIDGTLPYITIQRDSVYQVETDTRTGKKSTYKINWVDACTYELTFVSSDEKQMRKDAKKIGVLRVTITYTDEDGYRYMATSTTITEPIRGSVKIKK